MEARIYTNAELSLEQYHGATLGISKSGLDAIDRSPLHYWARYLNPDRVEKEDTAARIAGKAFHAMMESPEIFSQQFCLQPKREAFPQSVQTIEDIVRRAEERGISLKKGKRDDMLAQLQAQCPDVQTWDFLQEYIVGQKQVLTPLQWDRVHRQFENVSRHPAFKVIFGNGGGRAEHSFFWRDPMTGVLCKTRPDYISSSGIILDYKTTEDARPKVFIKSVLKYRYDVSAAFGLDGVCAHEPEAGPYVLLAIEKEEPYAAAFYEMDGEALEIGRIQYSKNLQRYAECLKADRWPGYQPTIESLSLPGWKIKEFR